MNTVEEIVIKTLSEHTNEQVNLDSSIVDDLSINSMDLLLVIASLEEQLKIKIPEEKLDDISLVSDLCDFVNNILNNKA